MPRRKQAKPRSLKQSCDVMLPGPDSAWNSPPSPLSPASSHDSEFTIHSETEGSCSEGANSASELADSELGCTVGVTQSTPYPCHFCQKAFPRLTYLNTHEQTHSEHMPFRCEYCSRLFKHKRSRDRHIKLHTGDKKYRCMQCEAAFSRSDHLKIHMKTHDNQKPFQCNVCNRGYNTAAALTSHMQNHKRPMEEESVSGPSSFKCLHCNWTFERVEELTTHIGKKHNGASGYASSKRKRADLPSTITNLACKYCTKVNFDSMEMLKHHIHEMHGLLLKETDPRDFSQPRPSSSLGEVSCPLCTMAFVTTGAFRSHVTSVHGINQGQDPDQFANNYSKSVNNNDLEERSYIHKKTHIPSLLDQTKPTDLSIVKKQEEDRPITVKKNRVSQSNVESGLLPSIHQGRQYEHPGTLLCNQCNAAVPDFESFRSHLKSHLEESLGTVDPDISSNQFGHCPYCDSHLPSLQEMTRHIGSHLKATVTEYSCQICQKPCPKSEEVQRHLLEEHAQRLYRCAVCKDIFESKVAIQVHFTVKHCIEVEKFRCTACPSLPPVDSQLEFTFHLRSAHTRYISSSPTTSTIIKSQNFLRCIFCNITFGTEMELRFHLAVHTKQFKCPMCPETFHIEYLLEKHVQSLHGPKVNLKEEQDHDKNCNSHHQNNTPGSNSSSSNGSVVSDLLKRQEAQFNNNNNTTEMCDICECAEFASEAELNAHRKLVHHIKSSSTKVSLHCAYCSENCKSRSELENHMKTHSQGSLTSSKYKCNICDEICVSIATLAEHKLTHCKVIYGSTCTLCKSVLSSEDDFVKHVLKHNNGLPNRGHQSVSCVVCRQTLQTELETRLHAKFHLQPEKIQCFRCLHNCDKSEIKNNLCFNCHDENNTPTKCPHCTVKFETVSALETHLSTIRNELHQCDKCLVSFESEEEVQAHIDIENCAKWKCNLCMTNMTNPLMLKCHLIEHTFAGCSNFACYMCSATYTTSSPLQAHMLDHGLQSRPYSCSVCPIKFFFRAELDNHSLLHKYKKQISTEKNEPEKIQHFDENSQTTLRRDSKYIGIKSESGKPEEDYCSMPSANDIVVKNIESIREGNVKISCPTFDMWEENGTTDKTGVEGEGMARDGIT